MHDRHEQIRDAMNTAMMDFARLRILVDQIEDIGNDIANEKVQLLAQVATEFARASEERAAKELDLIDGIGTSKGEVKHD